MNTFDNRIGIKCDLCGTSRAVVKCEKCNSQMFCLSCDYMYHQHPKRHTHLRKAIDFRPYLVQSPILDRDELRPPLPPKTPLLIAPVPPPRRNRKFGTFRSLMPGPFFGKRDTTPQQEDVKEYFSPKKESFFKEKMENLKRLMNTKYHYKDRNSYEDTIFPSSSGVDANFPNLNENSWNTPVPHYVKPLGEFGTPIQENHPHSRNFLSAEIENLQDDVSAARHRSSSFNGRDNQISTDSLADANRNAMSTLNVNCFSPNLQNFRKQKQLECSSMALMHNPCCNSHCCCSYIGKPQGRYCNRMFGGQDAHNVYTQEHEHCCACPAPLQMWSNIPAYGLPIPVSPFYPMGLGMSPYLSVSGSTQSLNAFAVKNNSYGSLNSRKSRKFKGLKKNEKVYKEYASMSRLNLESDVDRFSSDSEGTYSGNESECEETRSKSGGKIHCKHCTYKNPEYQKICQMCFKSLSSNTKRSRKFNFFKHSSPKTDSRKVLTSKKTDCNMTSLCEKIKEENSEDEINAELVANDNSSISGLENCSEMYSESCTAAENAEMAKNQPNDEKNSSMDQRSRLHWSFSSGGRGNISASFKEKASHDFRNENSSRSEIESFKSSIEKPDSFQLSTAMLKSTENDFLSSQKVIKQDEYKTKFTERTNEVLCSPHSWDHEVNTVVTIVNNYSHKDMNNWLGKISAAEAEESIKKSGADIWNACSICIEDRRKKIKEMKARGDFLYEDIVSALYEEGGHLDRTFSRLNKFSHFHLELEKTPITKAFLKEKDKSEEMPCALKTSMTDAEIENVSGKKENNTFKVMLDHELTESRDQDKIVARLMQLEFDESQALEASKHCSDVYCAIRFLGQECQLCTMSFSAKQIITMLYCTHICCFTCARAHFTAAITEKSIVNVKCPFCDEPNLNNLETAQEYFNHMDIFLKSLVPVEVHSLFQQKLRDWTLRRDPDFRWCVKCSFGFIANTTVLRITCPNCDTSFCSSCLSVWEMDHTGRSCREFVEMKSVNSITSDERFIEHQLEKNGIECSRCHFRFLLAKGGCMHFICTQCRFEFCSGCGQEFKLGANCKKNKYCAKLGLHAHHPRNCLFYMRDKDVNVLQNLLKVNLIHFETDSINPSDQCQVMEQKQTSMGFLDDICGRSVEDKQAGLCKIHYIEYLGNLISKNNLDPVSIFDCDDLELLLKRCDIKMTYRRMDASCQNYRDTLLKIVQEKIPLNPAVSRDDEISMK